MRKTNTAGGITFTVLITTKLELLTVCGVVLAQKQTQDQSKTRDPRGKFTHLLSSNV